MNRPPLYPRVIGLCGAIGCGKSTVAEYLRAHYGYQRRAFALALKHVALDIFGPLGAESRNFFGTQEEKARVIPGIVGPNGEERTGRGILEHLGTEGFRAIDPDVWAKTLLKQFKLDGQRYVIEDARFKNEFEAIRGTTRGVLWRVVKIGGSDKLDTYHSSDMGWRTVDPDATIAARSGDLASLYAQIDILLRGRTT